jgi:hypothetical protein
MFFFFVDLDSGYWNETCGEIWTRFGEESENWDAETFGEFRNGCCETNFSF